MELPLVRRRGRELWWCIPAGVTLIVAGLLGAGLTDLVAGGAGLLVAGLLARRPGWALVLLVVFLALQPVGLPAILAVGVPVKVVRAAGGFKEAMVLALLIAAATEIVTRRRRPDRLDAVIVLYLAVVTFELVWPGVLSAHPPLWLHARLLAWRDDCGYALVALAVRHAPLTGRDRRAFGYSVSILAALLVLVAFYQRIDPTGFTHFAINTVQEPRYLAYVLHEPSRAIALAVQDLTNSNPVRVSSLLLYPFDLGDYLVMVSAVLAEVVVRQRHVPWAWPLLIGSMAAIYLTEVRGDLAAAALVLLAALLPVRGRTRRGRGQLALLLVLAALAALPVVSGSRYLGGHGASSSTGVHTSELRTAWSTFEHHPFGLGLGNQPAAASRFQTIGGNAAVGDNVVLQVAVELGVLALLPWLMMMGLLLDRCRRSSGRDFLAAGAGMGLLGLLVAGQTHPALVSFAAPWTLMAALGLALPSTPRETPAPLAPVTGRAT